MLQIGIKGQSNKNLMDIELYYGNKTAVALLNFSSTIYLPGELVSGRCQCLSLRRRRSNRAARSNLALRVNMEPIPSTIDSRAQIKQMGTCECLKEYQHAPKMTLAFTYVDVAHHKRMLTDRSRYNNNPQSIDFSFPIHVNKYMTKADMDSSNFFLRWRNLDK